jgi:hypothetical protein
MLQRSKTPTPSQQQTRSGGGSGAAARSGGGGGKQQQQQQQQTGSRSTQLFLDLGQVRGGMLGVRQQHNAAAPLLAVCAQPTPRRTLLHAAAATWLPVVLAA